MFTLFSRITNYRIFYENKNTLINTQEMKKKQIKTKTKTKAKLKK